MHGLCHTIALNLHRTYQLPFVIVTDYDEDFEGDVLVHAATRLPNGCIIDAQNIYENDAEFEDFLEEEFEILTEFQIKDHSTIPLLLQTIEKDLSIEDVIDEEGPRFIYGYITRYVGSLINTSKKSQTILERLHLAEPPTFLDSIPNSDTVIVRHVFKYKGRQLTVKQKLHLRDVSNLKVVLKTYAQAAYTIHRTKNFEGYVQELGNSSSSLLSPGFLKEYEDTLRKANRLHQFLGEDWKEFVSLYFTA